MMVARGTATLLAALLVMTNLVRAEELARLDARAMATLAVQDHGRKKPFTSFAQEMLLTLSGRSSWHDDEHGRRLSANEVVLDLWLKPAGWDTQPLILLQNLELKKRFGLPAEKKLFAYSELISQPALTELLQQAQQLRRADHEKDLTDAQREAEHLGERLRLFQELVTGQREAILPHPQYNDGRWLPVQNLGTLTGEAWPLVETESAYYEASSSSAQTAGRAFTAWAEAYRKGDLAAFNQQTPQVVEAFRALAPSRYPTASSLLFEYQFTSIEPFLWAWIVYFVALIILLGTAIWAKQTGYVVAWLFVLIGMALEIYGFSCRVLISGRAPVTNLYETVIWVSFGAMFFAVILEAIYRPRFFFYAGLPASILTLIVADSQPTILDASINPLTAVLRNNMWLTIHVLTIVSSYAAFVLTAALGHLTLVLSLWGKRQAKTVDELTFFTYRAMQIGVLLLTTGTILGAVWANYSWGRYWGWDPKETWALITLLCYLALLHGRLAGWWHGFGLAVGSVVCFFAVLMSWYGVNFILGQNGKSLHSYGLSTGGFGYVAVYVTVEVVFLGIVLWAQLKRKQLAKA